MNERTKSLHCALCELCSQGNGAISTPELLLTGLLRSVPPTVHIHMTASGMQSTPGNRHKQGLLVSIYMA